MKLDNTNFSRTKTEAERKAEKLKPIKNAEDVWKQQSGSENEIALLYVALARAAGLQVWPMQVVNRDHASFDAHYLTSSQLDDYIAVLNLGGNEVYLDPGQKMCPFGSLHWKHSLASGFRLSDKNATIATTPPIAYKTAAVQRIANLQVDERGSILGTVNLTMSGPEALRWRQKALQNDPDEVKKQFNESIRDSVPAGVDIEIDHFLALDDPDSKLTAIANVTGNIGSSTGKHFFLPGMFFESRANLPFVAQEKRTIPVDVHHPGVDQDVTVYRLPPGFSIDSGPKTDDIVWPDHAMLRINYSAQNNQAKVVRILAHNYSLLDPKDYNDLHGFYQKVAAADQQQLVLTRTSAAPGN
jgi:hypothetical protein